MTLQKKALMALGILALSVAVVIAATWLFSKKYHGDNPFSVVPLNTGNTAGDTKNDGANTVVLGGELANHAAPTLERAIPATSPDIDPAARTSTIAFLNTSIENLKKDPNSYQDWVNLGLARQMLGDYVGAEEVWMYAIKIAPIEPVAYNNLGNLYMLSIKDGAKSELYFKDAVSLNPKDPSGYRSLFELYSYHYKQDTNAGELILKEGISKNPDAYDLGVLLARYYTEHGKVAEAQAAYTAAAEAALRGGYTDIAASIRTERDQRK